MTTVAVPDTASPKRWRTFLRARFTREGAVGLYLTAGFFACCGCTDAQPPERAKIAINKPRRMRAIARP